MSTSAWPCRLRRGLVEVAGVGQPQAGGDQLGVLGVERPLEVAPPVDRLREGDLGLGLLGRLVLVEDGVGLGRPVLHRPRRRLALQRLEQRDDGGLVLRPQRRAPIGDVGDDDLDLPIEQATGQPRLGGRRQIEQPPAGLEHPVGGLVGPSQRVADPGGHRGVAVLFVLAAPVELREGHGELGREARVQLGDFGHGGAVRGNLQGLDRFGQRLEHLPSVHQFV